MTDRYSLLTPARPDGEGRAEPTKQGALARWAAVLAGLTLAFIGYHIFADRYHWYPAMIGDGVLFWDSRVFVAGAERMASGVDPYVGMVREVPGPLPFISPPAFTHLLGAIFSVLGPGLFDLLALSHVLALVVVPLVLSRLFLGRDWTDAALGYGLFAAAFGAYGVTTILAGNFGATLYLLIFGALIHALRSGNWMWFHAALIVASQVKMPYALFWAVPVMLNGWDWRQLRDAAVAGVIAAAPYAVSFIAEPDFTAAWIAGLGRQVGAEHDFGVGVYNATMWAFGPDRAGLAPMAAQAAVCLALFVYLLFDKTRGAMRLAALVTFVILANPRMKEYDIAFAAIPAAALYLTALAPGGSAALQRAGAIVFLVLMSGALLKLGWRPVWGPYVYAAGLIGAILTTRLAPPLLAFARGLAPAKAGS